MLRIRGSARLLVLLGASGSGKSSLLRADVLPRLARSGHRWLLVPPFRPQSAPCQALAQALTLAGRDDRDWRRLDRRLREASSTAQLAALLQGLAADLRLAHQAPGAQILLSVDQAEERFAEAESAEVRRFFTLLSTAITTAESFQVILTLRSDFLGALQAASGLTIRLQEMSLSPLPSERIASIIQGPAQVAGIRVEGAFVQAASHGAQSEDALPLLAFALREIFDRAGCDGVLSLSDYQTLGDADAQLSPPWRTPCAAPQMGG